MVNTDKMTVEDLVKISAAFAILVCGNKSILEIDPTEMRLRLRIALGDDSKKFMNKEQKKLYEDYLYKWEVD